MKNLITKFAGWFTPARRQAIQAAVAAVVPLFVFFRVLAPADVEPILVISTVALQVLAGGIALINLTPSQAATWFGTVGRGVIYGVAATVAPALTTLGFLAADTAAAALEGLSVALTALAAVVAIANKPAAA